MSTPIKPGSLKIVYFVEQQLEGWTFQRSHWPLHVTIVPWFTVADEELTVRSLERVAHQTHAISLSVGNQEMLGLLGTVPVNSIVNQAPAMALHQILVDTLVATDVTFDEQGFYGAHYIAHVNRHVADNRHSSKGEEILLNYFQLVRLINDSSCLVEQQFMLR